MATFPFDPTPFLPAGCQDIEVQGRPARARVIHGNISHVNKDLAIATLVPMPQGEVAFVNVREVLMDFLHSLHLRVKSITQCPFGQAYVPMNSASDRDFLVNRSPHPFDDIHIVFQKHNEGLNWKNFSLNRDVWLLLVGFPADLRSFHEIANATSSFGQLMTWDRVKTTDAAVVVKVKIDMLKDIPISILVFGSAQFRGQSWTCHVVIFQDQPLGDGPADEDHVPINGNPHPRPPEQFHHPNQLNLFLGPVPFHQKIHPQDNNVQDPIDHQQGMAADEEEGWGHWAMPQAEPLVDIELQAGEFLALNDLMGPLEVQEAQPMEEDGSGVTLSLGLPALSASTIESVRGGPNLHEFADLVAPFAIPPNQAPVAIVDWDLNDPPLPASPIIQEQEILLAIQEQEQVAPPNIARENQNRDLSTDVRQNITATASATDVASQIAAAPATETLLQENLVLQDVVPVLQENLVNVADLAVKDTGHQQFQSPGSEFCNIPSKNCSLAHLNLISVCPSASHEADSLPHQENKCDDPCPTVH